MKRTNWRDTAELVDIAAMVASLVFVGLQLRQDERTAQLEQFGRAEEQLRGISELIAEHADLWYGGCSGAELGDGDQVIFTQKSIIDYCGIWNREPDDVCF